MWDPRRLQLQGPRVVVLDQKTTLPAATSGRPLGHAAEHGNIDPRRTSHAADPTAGGPYNGSDMPERSGPRPARTRRSAPRRAPGRTTPPKRGDTVRDRLR